MFVVQLHTKEVRAALLSKLIGVLLTKILRAISNVFRALRLFSVPSVLKLLRSVGPSQCQLSNGGRPRG
jgi:hypothetical protein